MKALQDPGVDVIFGYPGGAVLPIYDALFQMGGVEHVLVRHEQGAVHSARVTRARPARSAWCGHLRTRRDQRGDGPDRRADGFHPGRLLHGEVPTHLIGSDAFQECDTSASPGIAPSTITS